MILPILRLVLIYFLLVAGVVAVFNRDKLAPLLPGARDRATLAETAPAEPAAPLAEVPAIESAPAEATTAPDGTGEGGDGPLFPEPTQLDGAGSDASAAGAPAPEVTPAPGIAPQSAPLQTTPSGTPAEPTGDPVGVAGQGAPAAALPPVPQAATDAPAQPAKPGSPAPLGTPVASAPQPDTDPAPLAVPQAAEPAAAPGVETAPVTAPETAPAAAADRAAPTAPTPAPSPDGSDAAAALTEAIGTARAAYWSGDIEGARAGMNALAEAHPDNPDVAGELGNLAFALRDYPAAAEDWHRAGLLLIDRGESARVMSFLPFLQSIAPDKAAELAARLQER